MPTETLPPAASLPPAWSQAPAPEWRWLAQDADGRWFWYRTLPELGWAGGIWRSNSRNQQLAAEGLPNENWANSLLERPSTD